MKLTTLTVSVTEQDIRAGEPMECARCPIAIATARAVKSVLGIQNPVVFVKPPRIAIVTRDDVHDELIMTGQLPRHLLDFICKFDNGCPVQPVDFRLTLVDA